MLANRSSFYLYPTIQKHLLHTPCHNNSIEESFRYIKSLTYFSSLLSKYTTPFPLPLTPPTQTSPSSSYSYSFESLSPFMVGSNKSLTSLAASARWWLIRSAAPGPAPAFLQTMLNWTEFSLIMYAILCRW